MRAGLARGRRRARRNAPGGPAHRGPAMSGPQLIRFVIAADDSGFVHFEIDAEAEDRGPAFEMEPAFALSLADNLMGMAAVCRRDPGHAKKIPMPDAEARAMLKLWRA